LNQRVFEKRNDFSGFCLIRRLHLSENEEKAKFNRRRTFGEIRVVSVLFFPNEIIVAFKIHALQNKTTHTHTQKKTEQ